MNLKPPKCNPPEISTLICLAQAAHLSSHETMDSKICIRQQKNSTPLLPCTMANLKIVPVMENCALSRKLRNFEKKIVAHISLEKTPTVVYSDISFEKFYNENIINFVLYRRKAPSLILNEAK